jgi:hypothetical protein
MGCQACSSSSSAFASLRSNVSKPSVNQPQTGASSSRACCTPCPGHARGARGPIRRAWRPTESRRWLPIPSQDYPLPAGGVPADTNNRHRRDRPQRGAGEREPMRSQSLHRRRPSGALYSNRLCPPTKAPPTQAKARLEASFSRDYA